MEQIKIISALIVAILLQWSLPIVFRQAVFVDLPLLVVVYVALQRESLKAMLFATAAGVAVDALSGSLLGAGGFAKTITAFVVAELARRVLLLDNPLLRIPVLAGASALTSLIYFSMHWLLGQTPNSPLAETLGYTVLGTTIAGTICLFIMEWFFSERARGRRQNSGYTPRRNSFRRNPIRLNKRV